MTIRFNDSLPVLVTTLRAAGIDVEAPSTVIVRDATGRLLVALTERKVTAELMADLSTALGAYAASTPALDGSIAKRLANDPSIRVMTLEIDDEVLNVRLIDRRVVGADWLRDPAPRSTSGPPRLVFGSLKGGVGRSTALTVFAADLARHGLRVLVVDLDIEAPGLGFILLPSGDGDLRTDLRPRFGVVDYLVENNLGGIADDELMDFIGVSDLVNGLIHVIPAVGRDTDEHPELMIAKLSRALVEDVQEDGQRISVAQQVREMIDRFVANGDYDAVLVDARAGMAEISASALFGIGASDVLYFGTDQPQTFRGYRYALAHFVATWGVGMDSRIGDWRSRLSFVHAKAPSSRQKREKFRGHLHDLCSELLYDEDDPSASGGGLDLFNFSPDITGPGVPHDALYIAYHPDYDAFDPLEDRTQLDEDVYRGPFGDFLERAWELLNLKRSDGRQRG